MSETESERKALYTAQAHAHQVCPYSHATTRGNIEVELTANGARVD